MGVLSATSLLGRGQAVALAVTLALGAAGVVLGGAPAHAAPVCVGWQTDEVAAGRMAKACRQRVEVLAERTETTTVYANPNGVMTAEVTLKPTRVKRGDGSWVPADARLQRRADGTLSPVAATLPIVFSGGGAGPVARISNGDRELAVSWPGVGTLPVPRIEGDSAIYPDVLAGVDLRLTADVEGYSEVLVVKNRQAAANPALTQLTFATVTKGLTLRTDRAGALTARDAAGDTVFSGSTPLMWDSSSVPAAKTAQAKPGAQAIDANGDGAGAGDLLPGKRRAMRTEVAGGRLTVSPDVSLLTGDDTVYPVYVDPSWGGGKNHWTMLWKEFGGTSYWDRTCVNCSDPEPEKQSGLVRVGYQNFDGVSTIRSLFEMDTSAVRGKQLIGAKFSITQSWSGKACGGGAGATSLWRTGGINSGLTWNNSGGLSWAEKMASNADVRRYNGSGGCAQGRVEWDAAAAVQAAINANATATTVGLRADSESDQYSWRRYQLDPVLAIDFNSVPGVPANLSPHQGQAACGGVVGTYSPVLQAQYVDTDGQDTLSAKFAWQELPSGPVTTVAGPSRPANNNGTVTLNLGTGSEGKQYRFQVQTNDSHADSPWSDWCTFTVDTAAPDAPDIIPTASGTAPVYLQCDPGAVSGCTPLGGPGIAGAFKFSEPPGKGLDVIRYVYGWDSPSVPVTVSAGAATPPILLTPPRYGLNRLTAYSVDGAGHKSQTASFYFLVKAPSSAVAYWPLDSLDSHGFTNQIGLGTLTTSNVTWTPDARYYDANAATFNGTGSEATQLVPSFDTSGSFSVAAWTRLSTGACSGNATAVAIDADPVAANNHASGFLLSYDCTSARWRMRVAAQNVGAPLLADAVSPNNSVAPGRWTFVVGTYDEASNTVKLWLDGALVSTVTAGADWVNAHGAGWKATGPVTIGRDRFNDASGHRFAGEIADVRLWNRALVEQDITGANADGNGVPDVTALTAPRVVGQWQFPEGECWCVNSPDSSGFERQLTLVPNWLIDPQWSSDPATAPAWLADFGEDGNGGLVLDGTSGYASTADDKATLDPNDDTQHLVLRTDQSYTVSAWADTKATGTDQVVVRQGTVGLTSVFKLMLLTDNRWAFQVSTPNGSGGYTWTTAASSPIATAGKWTHVAGVFDAPTGQVQLYVDGVRVDTASGAAGWNSTGSLQIGSTGGSQYFNGTIDQVQVFQGAMNNREVANLYGGPTPTDHSWPLADMPDGASSGTPVTTSADNVPTGVALPMTATAGTTWQTGDKFSPAIDLNGITGSLATTTNPVNTNADFSVSVWVKPAAASGTVISQDATNTAGLKIWAEPADNSWRFAMPATDTTNSAWDVARAAGGTVQPGVWTQLTATYTESTGRMNLFINGANVATANHTAAWDAVGGLQVGRARATATSYGNYLAGRVAKVQTFAAVTAPGTCDLTYCGMVNTLYAGDVLKPNDSIMSPNGRYVLTMQGDSNLVTHDTSTTAWTPIWSTGTSQQPDNAWLTMQDDGNLVMYRQGSSCHCGADAYWSSGTAGHPGARLALQDDGKAVIYDTNGTQLWATTIAWWPVGGGGTVPTGWNLAFVKTRNTSFGAVEVHLLQSPYQSFDFHATTGFSAGEDGLGSFEMVGNELVYFKTRNTATGKIELHTRSVSSGFTQGRDLATVFNVGDGPNGVFELVNGDIVFIKTRNTGSGRVEVHRISGANLSGSPSLDVATIISSAEADNGTFQMSGNDLVFIKTRNTGSGKVEVHVVDGGTNYATWKLHTATTISAGEGDNGVFSIRNVTSSSGVGDLVFVKTRNTNTGTVELFIATAGSVYQQLSLATPTAINVGEGGNGWFNLNHP